MSITKRTMENDDERLRIAQAICEGNDAIRVCGDCGTVEWLDAGDSEEKRCYATAVGMFGNQRDNPEMAIFTDKKQVAEFIQKALNEVSVESCGCSRQCTSTNASVQEV